MMEIKEVGFASFLERLHRPAGVPNQASYTEKRTGFGF